MHSWKNSWLLCMFQGMGWWDVLVLRPSMYCYIYLSACLRKALMKKIESSLFFLDFFRVLAEFFHQIPPISLSFPSQLSRSITPLTHHHPCLESPKWNLSLSLSDSRTMSRAATGLSSNSPTMADEGDVDPLLFPSWGECPSPFLWSSGPETEMIVRKIFHLFFIRVILSFHFQLTAKKQCYDRNSLEGIALNF